MSDPIERQDAIDAVNELCENYTPTKSVKHPHIDFVIEELHHLPSAQPEVLACGEGELSAQPEIITCNDCIHSDTFPEGADNDMPLKCLDIRYGGVMPDWYCEHAERREDG